MMNTVRSAEILKIKKNSKVIVDHWRELIDNQWFMIHIIICVNLGKVQALTPDGWS
jgi:hypothetical protein